MRLERDIVIGRPVGDVFSYVSEPANLPSWQPAVVEVRRPEGEIDVGSRFGETRNFVGKRFQTTVEVVALEPDRLFGIRVVDGPLPITIHHLFEPAGDGTRLTIPARRSCAVRCGSRAASWRRRPSATPARTSRG